LSHKSDLDCFIKGFEAEGTILFDAHGASCYTCLAIARDTERLLSEGKVLSEIRTYIDDAYSEKGPATNTPWPPE
jgi:hypothetical protein